MYTYYNNLLIENKDYINLFSKISIKAINDMKRFIYENGSHINGNKKLLNIYDLYLNHYVVI